MDRRKFLTVVGATTLSGCASSLVNEVDPTADLPSSVTDNQVEVTFSQWYSKRYFRYYDSQSDSLKKHYPESEWWLEASIDIENLGGNPIEPPNHSNFEMESSDETFTGSTEVPGISWANVRLREHGKMYWIEPGYLGSSQSIEPGDGRLLYLLFDVPADDSPVLLWDSETETHQLKSEFSLTPES